MHDCLEQKNDVKAQLVNEQKLKLQKLSALTAMSAESTTPNSSPSSDTLKLETLGTVAAALAENPEPMLMDNVEKVEEVDANGKITPLLINKNGFDGNPPVSVVKPTSSVVIGVNGSSSKGHIKIVKCLDPDKTSVDDRPAATVLVVTSENQANQPGKVISALRR